MEYTKEEKQADLAEIDRLWQEYQDLANFYPYNQDSREAKLAFERDKIRVECKYGMKLKDLRISLMAEDDQKFIRQFTHLVSKGD